MNDYVGHQGRFDAMYYWDQFHPILSAIAILIIGWIIALLIAGAVKKVLTKIGTNQNFPVLLVIAQILKILFLELCFGSS